MNRSLRVDLRLSDRTAARRKDNRTVAVERLALVSSGQVRYQLKTAYRDGTTHIVLEPLDLMARVAALVPPPADAPDEISWGIRATQQAQGCGDAGASGYREQRAGR